MCYPNNINWSDLFSKYSRHFSKPHTAEYLVDLAQESIQKCEEDFDCHVGTVVTDKAANVAKMRKLLEDTSELNLVTYECSAHILNLLAHDLEIGNVKENVVWLL